MMDWLTTLRRRCDPRRIPAIRLAFALSIALHAVALFWGWSPMVARPPAEDPKQAKPSRLLTLQLAPPPSPLPGAVPTPPPAPMPRLQSQAERKPVAKAAPRPPSAPPVLAVERPGTSPVAPPIAPPPPAEPASPPPAARSTGIEDFAAFVAARQRARQAASAPVPASPPPTPPARVETEQERHSRTVAANLGLDRTPTLGERLAGGGIFQLQGVTSEEAELVFFGWNKDIRRNTRQTLSVRRGAYASIEIALVRRMITIIREHESGDFVWESQRLGRNITLSARPADDAGLEDVLMREFFPQYASRR